MTKHSSTGLAGGNSSTQTNEPAKTDSNQVVDEQQKQQTYHRLQHGSFSDLVLRNFYLWFDIICFDFLKTNKKISTFRG